MNSSINSSVSPWNQNEIINYIKLLQWQSQEQKLKYLREKSQVYRSKSFQKNMAEISNILTIIEWQK